jgi:transposase
MWQRQGCPRRIPAAGTDKRVTVFGALDYRSGRVQTLMADRGTGARFRQFLEQLVRRWPNDRLVLVLDNVAYHKTAAVRRWLAAHADRITVLWLPTYSPHLNRIERVWRFVKGKLACHRFGNDRPGLIHLANVLLHHVQAQYVDPTRPRLTLDHHQNLCRSA